MWPPSTTKIDSVALAVLAESATAPSAADRREHCLVSQQVLDGLGRTLHPTLGVYGQIRLIPDATNGRAAVFTIVGLNGQPGSVVSVYPDPIGGPSKLFTGSPPASLGNARVVSSPSSGVTRVPLGGLPQTVTVWPSAGGEFMETIMLGDSELLLLAPHGGLVESGTTEQIQYLVSLMSVLGPNLGTPTVWHCQGQLTSTNFNRLHITSTAISEHAFAGLDEAWQAAPYQGPIRYRYAVALHGMAGDTLEIVIGGRANTVEKQLVGQRIAAKFPATASLVIQYEGGTAPKNFLNRLSENVPPSASAPYRLGRGGIQIEQSMGVRSGTDPVSGKLYRDLVMEGLADALVELLGRNRVYVRDHLADDGTISTTPPTSCMSPDVCIRMTPPPAATLANKAAVLDNQEISIGTTATVWVRAYNANPTPPVSQFHAHVYDSVPATLVQPQMWNPLGVATLGVVGSNSTPTIGSFTTAVTTAGHRCLICILGDERYDLNVLKSQAQAWSITQFADFARRSRLAAWRNYQAVTLAGAMVLDVVIPGFGREDLEFRVEIVARLTDPGAKLFLVVPAALHDQLHIERTTLKVQRVEKLVKVLLPRDGVIDLGRGILPGTARHACRFELQSPKLMPGTLQIRQLYAPRGQSEVDVGSVTWELRKPKRSRTK
jgi:phage replication-related protein YjqB (UPF0714/DUF867 family)